MRLGEFYHSQSVARKLTRTHCVSCASPSYLQKRGTPTIPTDLAQPNCLAYVVPKTGRSPFIALMTEVIPPELPWERDLGLAVSTLE